MNLEDTIRSYILLLNCFYAGVSSETYSGQFEALNLHLRGGLSDVLDKRETVARYCIYKII